MRSLWRLIIALLAWAAPLALADSRSEAALALRAERTPSAALEAVPGGRLRSEHNLLAFAAPLRRDGTLTLGFEYAYTRYEYDGIDSRDRDLHRLQIPLSGTLDRGRWSLRVLLSPGIATSSNVFGDPFARAGSDDLIVNARLLAQRRDAAGRTWIAGVARDRALGAPRFYPVAGLLLQPGPALSLRLGFPLTALRWRPSAANAFRLRVYPAGQQWHVLTDDLAQRFAYRVEAVRGELLWTFRPRPWLALDVGTYFEGDRRHALVDDRGDALTLRPQGGWGASLGLRLGAGPLPFPHVTFSEVGDR